MREVEQKNYTYSNDEFVSVFVGNCNSQELLNRYLKKIMNFWKLIALVLNLGLILE